MTPNQVSDKMRSNFKHHNSGIKFTKINTLQPYPITLKIYKIGVHGMKVNFSDYKKEKHISINKMFLKLNKVLVNDLQKYIGAQ